MNRNIDVAKPSPRMPPSGDGTTAYSLDWQPPLATFGLRGGPEKNNDDYLSKLLKYIPGEVVASYVAIDAILRSSLTGRELHAWLIGLFLLGLLVTPLYLRRLLDVRSTVQLVLSTLAFATWVFAIGGFFQFQDWYQPFMGGVALIVATLLIPLVNPQT